MKNEYYLSQLKEEVEMLDIDDLAFLILFVIGRFCEISNNDCKACLLKSSRCLKIHDWALNHITNALTEEDEDDR